MNERVVVVAAHPDDDILGCGGVLALHVDAGDEILVIFLADGVSSREAPLKAQEERMANARNALGEIGVTSLVGLNFPDNQLDSIPILTLAKAVNEYIEEWKPNTIYTHSAADLNVDHRIAFEIALISSRPEPKSSVDRVLSFEVPSSTGWGSPQHAFNPRYFVNIEATLSRKMSALRHYDDEMRAWPHARSYKAVEALAMARGASVGVPAAEAFDVIRWIR
jgi:LmbE family N-acetylglucosaminyl deacetylase